MASFTHFDDKKKVNSICLTSSTRVGLGETVFKKTQANPYFNCIFSSLVLLFTTKIHQYVEINWKCLEHNMDNMNIYRLLNGIVCIP